MRLKFKRHVVNFTFNSFLHTKIWSSAFYVKKLSFSSIPEMRKYVAEIVFTNRPVSIREKVEALICDVSPQDLSVE